jgi:hypothetical protein
MMMRTKSYSVAAALAVGACVVLGCGQAAAPPVAGDKDGDGVPDNVDKCADQKEDGQDAAPSAESVNESETRS